MSWLALAGAVWLLASLAAGLLIGKSAAFDEKLACSAPVLPEPVAGGLALLR